MIEGLQPYSEYKESGSRWLAHIPESWRVQSLRTLLTKRNERNRPELPLLSVAREKGVFVRSLEDDDENHNVIPEDLSNYKVARAGSLVINKMKAWQGSMGIAPCDGIVSPAYFVFDFAIENRAFGQRLLRSRPYVAHFAAASDGVRVGQWDLSVPGMRQIPVLIPSPGEQSAIVRFLDHANRKIDGFIRAKRRVIGLLQEQKQAIIHRAVTRGLNPDAPLKPSGISWLGDIPKHWQMKKLRNLLKEHTRRGRPDLPLLSVVREKGVIVRDVDDLESNHNFIPDDLTNYKVVERGQFAMNKMKAWQGSYGVSDHTGIVSPAYFVFGLREVGGTFFHTALRSKAYVPFFTQASDGVRVGQWDLNQNRMREIPFYVPPPEEQSAIVAHVRNETASTEAAIARTQREIALMQEYRTRLTADVVTGKLDVRPAAAKLPDLPVDDLAPEDTMEENEPEESET